MLIVIAGTVIGMPAFAAAWRAGDLALPGLEHLAHDHVVDLLGPDAAALERGLDRDAAEVHRRCSDASAPESLPMGVRADETMTEPGMVILLRVDPRVTGMVAEPEVAAP